MTSPELGLLLTSVEFTTILANPVSTLQADAVCNSSQTLHALITEIKPANRPSWQIGLEIFTACFLWLVSIFGNVLVILVVHRSRRLQSTTNYFVVSLSFADLCMALLCMPFILGRVVAEEWMFGKFICKLVRFLQYMAPGATVYVLLAIGVDRFYTIIYPLSFKITRGKAKKMICVSWIISVTLSCPAFFFFNMSHDDVRDRHFCDTFIDYSAAGIIYITFLFITEYMLPSIMITLIYAKIIRHIWNVGISGRSVQRTMNSVPRTKVKTVQMLMIVTAVYFCSWTPFFITQLVYSGVDAQSYIDPTIYIAVVWIAFASSASNPMIYAYCNTNFRRGCKEVLCMSTLKCYRSNTYVITSTSIFARKNHVGVALGIIDMNDPRPISPYKSFDRDANGDKKMAWPLPAGGSTTYL